MQDVQKHTVSQRLAFDWCSARNLPEIVLDTMWPATVIHIPSSVVPVYFELFLMWDLIDSSAPHHPLNLILSILRSSGEIVPSLSVVKLVSVLVAPLAARGGSKYWGSPLSWPSLFRPFMSISWSILALCSSTSFIWSYSEESVIQLSFTKPLQRVFPFQKSVNVKDSFLRSLQ